MSTKRVPMKLPPLKSIRVQNASKKEINPCAHAMLSMLCKT